MNETWLMVGLFVLIGALCTIKRIGCRGNEACARYAQACNGQKTRLLNIDGIFPFSIQKASAMLSNIYNNLHYSGKRSLDMVWNIRRNYKVL